MQMNSGMRNLSLLFILLLVLQGCIATLDVTPEEVVSEINSALKQGDDAAKIEEYFATKKLGVSFDKYQNRYQSNIRHPESGFHAITIYVYVDSNKGFLGAEAFDSYTFL